MENKAIDFLTQEKIDKLQHDQDDNNGVVDDEAIALLMEEYHQHKLKSMVSSSDVIHCDLCTEESKRGNKVNKICTSCMKEYYVWRV